MGGGRDAGLLPGLSDRRAERPLALAEVGVDLHRLPAAAGAGARPGALDGVLILLAIGLACAGGALIAFQRRDLIS